MNVNIYYIKDYQIFIPLAGQKNKPNSNPIKPNLRKAKMNVNLTLTKDYRKKDDFVVRINKPNFRNGQNERKLNFNKGLQKKRLFSTPKNKPKTNPIKANPELAEALSAAEGAVEKLLILCPESVTIIRKSVIRQFKRDRLGWLLLGTVTKIILEHSPVASGLNLEISYYVNAILFGKDRF